MILTSTKGQNLSLHCSTALRASGCSRGRPALIALQAAERWSAASLQAEASPTVDTPGETHVGFFSLADDRFITHNQIGASICPYMESVFGFDLVSPAAEDTVNLFALE